MLRLLSLTLVHCASSGLADAQPAFPFPPPTSAFPAFYFGANATGAETSEWLSFVRQHALAGYGWQHKTLVTNFSHIEVSLAQAATRLAQSNANVPPIFIYRNMQIAWAAFDAQARATVDPSLNGMLLRNFDNSPDGELCEMPASGGGLAQFFAWTNASSATYWLGEVIAEAAAEDDANAVFFDETDWNYCGYSLNKDACPNISKAFLAADLTAKYSALRATAEALAAAGKVAIFSSKNMLAASWEGLQPPEQPPCVMPEDGYLKALSGVLWLRFYEFW